jgi:hypothetical protein
MQRLFPSFSLFFILLGLSQPVTAAFNCDAKVVHVLVYASGLVNIVHTGRNDFTVVCSLSNEWKGVGVTTCASWFALLESAKRRNGTVNFYYEGVGSCEALPTYSDSPAPVYIGDMKS